MGAVRGSCAPPSTTRGRTANTNTELISTSSIPKRFMGPPLGRIQRRTSLCCTLVMLIAGPFDAVNPPGGQRKAPEPLLHQSPVPASAMGDFSLHVGYNRCTCPARPTGSAADDCA